MEDSKKEISEYFPWEGEDGRKKKAKRGDSIPPRTNIQSRVHSKPKTDGQDYLDLFIRAKEKERTERYGEILGKQMKEVSDSWRDIKNDMIQREKELPKIPKGGLEESEEMPPRVTRGKKVPGHMKKMDWNY